MLQIPLQSIVISYLSSYIIVINISNVILFTIFADSQLEINNDTINGQSQILSNSSSFYKIVTGYNNEVIL